MRAAYHEELAAIRDILVRMARLAGSAMGRATTAVLDTDLRLARSVVEADAKLDELQEDLEGRAIAVLACQQPVATDLRAVVAALRISADLERAGDLAQHVARLALRRFPDPVVPDELHTTVLEMGQLAQRLMAKATEAVATRNTEIALQLEQDDDRMDDLHREIFRHLLDQRWQHGVEAAVDVTLVGRYYERFADHAVSIAGHVLYLVTGERAEGLPSDPTARA